MGRLGERIRTAAFAAAAAGLVWGCGIYTVEIALTPPSGIGMSATSLTFTGDNTSEFEASSFENTGYMLWFKEEENGPYRPVQLNDEALSRPTIRVSEIPPVTLPPGVSAEESGLNKDGKPIIRYTVQVSNMKHPDEKRSFSDLIAEKSGLYDRFFFAVSAAGTDGAGNPTRSERAEFGSWPR